MARKFTFELQSSNDESPARPQENLNPDPERLLALKKREAEVKLELDRISAEKSALLQTRRLSIGIVGFGKFGQFMAKRFLAQGHTVSALSRAESSRDASDMGVTYFGGFDIDTNSNGEGGSAWEFMSQPHLDVVIFAVRLQCCQFLSVLKSYETSSICFHVRDCCRFQFLALKLACVACHCSCLPASRTALARP
jgi:hypothetical protein